MEDAMGAVITIMGDVIRRMLGNIGQAVRTIDRASSMQFSGRRHSVTEERADEPEDEEESGHARDNDQHGASDYRNGDAACQCNIAEHG